MSGKKKKNRKARMAENRAAREASEEAERELHEYTRRYEEFARGYDYLRGASGAAGFGAASGKILYEFSDSRTWLDFSKQKKRAIAKSAHGILLFSLAGLLVVWLIFSFIYRMSTEANKGSVALSMLPSLLVVGACAAILVISVLGVWGNFTRFALSRGLHGRGDRARIEAMKADFARADGNKRYENAITVYKDHVCFILYGNKYVFQKSAVLLEVSRDQGQLFPAFYIDGVKTEFPATIPADEFFLLNKAFRGKVKTVRANTQAEIGYNDKGQRLYGGYTLGSVIAGTVMSCVVLTAGILVTVAHYLWIREIPPFLGLFFVGGAGLAFCNTFSHIPFINRAGLPFVFAVILTVFPPWFLVWIEVNGMGHAFTLAYLLTHCTPHAAGLIFLSAMGIYALCFSIAQAADYMRFGANK